MQLNAPPGVQQTSLAFTWKTIDGNCHNTTVQLTIPPPLPPNSVSEAPCDPGMRKAVALTEYVRLLTKYSTDERFAPQVSQWAQPARPRVSSIRPDVRNRLQMAGANAILLMNAPELGVSDVQFLLHHEYARIFTDFLAYLQAEMLACGDGTLATSNRNIVETVSRIIEVEKSEFMSMLTVAANQQPAESNSAPSAPVDSGSSDDDEDDDGRNPSADTPASFICPISHLIFKDPVIAADDNTCVLSSQPTHTFFSATDMFLQVRALAHHPVAFDQQQITANECESPTQTPEAKPHPPQRNRRVFGIARCRRPVAPCGRCFGGSQQLQIVERVCFDVRATSNTFALRG